MKKSLVSLGLFVWMVAVLTAQTITVTKPAAGETLAKGSSCTIIWTKTGTMGANVRITLRNGSTLAEVLVIADPAPNSGSFSWTVPATVADGSYKIRVKVKNETISGDSGAFSIKAGPKIVQFPSPAGKVPPVGLIGHPALSISGAALVVYEDSFRITFAYENTGTGNLPKSSEMPVKPSFRVLVDGQVLNQGSLTIPAFPAPPGWEMPSFYGGEIALQASQTEWDINWTIGNTLAIFINENKVGGMAGDTKTYNLRQLALGHTFDAYITGATYDWKTEILTASVHIDGDWGAATKFRFYNTGTMNPAVVDKYRGGFVEDLGLVPGKHFYQLTHKVRDADQARVSKLEGVIGVLVIKAGSTYFDRHDVYHPNNSRHFVFHR
jgi:hypothetical protein